ncbi:MAG: aspartate/glutamate racemase family protein [Oceanospirillaceae bacterium]
MKIETLEHQFALQQVAPLGRIGVIALSTDINIEQDLRRMLPEGVEIFTSRIRNYNPLSIDNLRRMGDTIAQTADTILPGTKLDAVIFGCTSGAVAIGVEQVEKLIHQSCPNVPVTNPFSAALAAFKAHNIKRISVLTPYDSEVNVEVAATFAKSGIEVVNIAGFGFEDDTAMSFISAEDIAQAAKKICASNVDGLFLSCTALRASGVIEQLEKELSIPVFSSNQVLAWHSLALVNYKRPIKSFGQLLDQHRS